MDAVALQEILKGFPLLCSSLQTIGGYIIIQRGLDLAFLRWNDLHIVPGDYQGFLFGYPAVQGNGPEIDKQKGNYKKIRNYFVFAEPFSHRHLQPVGRYL
jgi:hypothetical protein